MSALEERTASPTELRKVTLAASLGTAVEYYDFAVYAFMASIIAPLFFPTEDPLVSLLLTFGAFASSYLVRPLGAVIFGPLGDKHGRRNVLSLVILIMSAATAMIGFLPTYAQAGVLAPVLLTLARLVQGVSIGGEFGGAAAYIGEFAPARTRAGYLGWLSVALGGGFFLGALAAAALTAVVSEDALSEWGWRIPFWLALPIGVVGVIIRRNLSDTPEFEAAAGSRDLTRTPLLSSLRKNYVGILLSIGLLAGMTVSTYLFVIYAPSYLRTVVGFSSGDSLRITAVAIAVYCVAAPFLARLCDRVGRKPVLIAGLIGLVILTYPGFAIISTSGPVGAGAALTVLTVLTVTTSVSVIPLLVELFATSTRYTSLGLGWNIAAAAFGGAAPLIATSLIKVSDSVTAPAFYGIGCCILSLITVTMVKETSGISLRSIDVAEAPPRSRET